MVIRDASVERWVAGDFSFWPTSDSVSYGSQQKKV